MYIAMHCINANNDLQDEICKFYGVHYDNRYKSCVISTDHQHHDFVMPMSETDYNDFYKKMLAALAADGGQVISIENARFSDAEKTRFVTVKIRSAT